MTKDDGGPAFPSEAALCAAFIAEVTSGKMSRRPWRAYPETAGFDILAVRDDGVQVGIEAKLRLNVAVVTQALPSAWAYAETGPDYRAVLVPWDAAQSGLDTICERLGVKVMRFAPGGYAKSTREGITFRVHNDGLPDNGYDERRWHEWCPVRRCTIPEYVPDVAAGASAPVKLTEWKVKAIKLAVLMEHRPVTRADFKALQIDPSRWTDRHTGWLRPTPEGYVPTSAMPDFRKQHPKNYAEIAADKLTWMRQAQLQLPDAMLAARTKGDGDAPA